MPDTNPEQRDLIREYLLYLRVEKGLAKNSIEAYGRDLEKLHAWAEKTGLGLISLTKKDLREWLMDTGRQKLSETSRQRLNSSVRGFYKFLAIDGHISKNPAEDLTSPKKGSYLPKFLNQNEIEQVLAAPDVSQESGLRDRAILELMYACGLRVSEVVNMKTSDVDLDAGIATFTGKGSKTRRVPVGSSAVDWLRAYLAQRSKIKDLTVSNLFVTPLGRPLDRQAVYLIVRGYAEQCGFTDVSPHTIRHSFATHLVQNRADIRSVQMMLGHSDISTTQIYTHMTDTHLRKSYEKFHPRAKRK